MAVYERAVEVSAPLSEVWEFHSRASGLEALTPGWMNLRIEETRGPDGEPDPGVLEAGSTVVSTVRPFGVGPRRRWVSEITERESGEGYALFRDVMAEGPFPEWEHTHRFAEDDGRTTVHDRVEYRLPLGPLGRVAEPFGRIGFEPMFRYRHRRTRELLE